MDLKKYSQNKGAVARLQSEAAKEGISFSEYQLDIFKEIIEGRGNILVNAVPGSGKTFTLTWAARLIQSENAIALAFNRHMANELKGRINKLEVKTINSLGFSFLWSNHRGNYNVEKWKYHRIVKNIVAEFYPLCAKQSYRTKRVFLDTQGKLIYNGVLELVQKAQLQLSYDYAALQRIYHIEGVTEADYHMVDRALIEGISQFRSTNTVDFNDQVWLHNVSNMEVLAFALRFSDMATTSRIVEDFNMGDGLPPAKTYDWIFVDEAQDLSPAGLAMIEKSSNGRILFVGDQNQAIMGFAGADTNSIEIIRETMDVHDLPLNICYRCPTSHIELAAKINPDIQASPHATQGNVIEIDEIDLSNHLQEGALVLSRTTAPLIRHCLAAIRLGLPAKVRGRDVSLRIIQFLRIVRSYSPDTADTFAGFRSALQQYSSDQFQRLTEDEFPEEKIEALSDNVESLLAIHDHTQGIVKYEEFEQAIKDLFSDHRPSIWFSTVHKAKGLEADMSFILYYDEFPYVRKGATPEQAKQEKNLQYVALTRSKRDMYFVEKIQQ